VFASIYLLCGTCYDKALKYANTQKRDPLKQVIMAFLDDLDRGEYTIRKPLENQPQSAHKYTVDVRGKHKALISEIKNNGYIPDMVLLEHHGESCYCCEASFKVEDDVLINATSARVAQKPFGDTMYPFPICDKCETYFSNNSDDEHRITSFAARKKYAVMERRAMDKLFERREA
jgi:hypothetical protein